MARSVENGTYVSRFMNPALDITRTCEELGYEPLYGLEQPVRDHIECLIKTLEPEL